MAYRESQLEGPSATLTILPGAHTTSFDIDAFGMDDGRSPDPRDAFRFLFQLGSGYMIYLYVIQAGAGGDPRHFFHTFWIKDCAVAEVEMEELGAPESVDTPEVALPLLYPSVTLTGVDPGSEEESRFELVSQRFSASPDPSSGQQLEMLFELRPLPGGAPGPAALRWSRHAAWELLDEAGHGRPLPAHGRVLFG